MKNILVPTDLSKIAENGLSVAAEVAKMVKGKIFLVNFLKHPFGETFTATGDIYTKYTTEENLFTVQLIRKHEADLKTLAEKHGDPELFSIVTQVYDEDFSDGIEDYIKDKNIDLVVMGTSGEETFKEKFTGNHVEQILREAPCPVISVRDDYRKRNMHHIVVGWDMDEQRNYSKAVDYINKLSDALKARLDIVHVTKPGSGKNEKLVQKLKDFSKDHKLTNFSLHLVEDDDVEDGLQRYADSVEAGMIVMLSRSLGGSARLFTHSSAEDMTQEADVPVYTINLHNI